jgi:hypothetical protein
MEWLGVDLRRMGTGLLVFGVIGMVIAGIVAIGLFAGAIAARDLDERLAADQARLVQTLQRVDSTMTQVVTTTRNAGATLGTTSETLAGAGDVLRRVGDTAEELSQSIDISILGTRPLASAAARFDELATDVRAFQDDAVRLSANLAVNSSDVGSLATEIEELQVQVAALSARVETFDTTGRLVGLLVWGIVLLGLLVAWLAVAGGFCAWMGLRLVRLAGTAQPET